MPITATITQFSGGLNAGVNECIGSFYDSLKQRILWFNWNSEGQHGIYQLKLQTGVITPLLICFVDSTTDILGFDLDFPIPSVNIVYTTESDGDILTWTARNKRPKQLNILNAENNLYGGNWLEEYLDVQSAPPSIPIKCAYEDDSTVVVNNVRKFIYKFKYRFWYDNFEKSVWSAWSEMPIPFKYTDTTVDQDVTKNARIALVFQTGLPNAKRIEVAACQNEGNGFSDFFSVIVLNKSILSIPDNDVYIWNFFNNEAYSNVDVEESILPFDWLPDLANTQELLNGNVIIYGGITEGHDPIVPDVSVTTLGDAYPLSVNISSKMSVTQNGLPGVGDTGDIHFVILGNPVLGAVYSATVFDGMADVTVAYTTVIADVDGNGRISTGSVIAGLLASAVGLGFTVVSTNFQNLIISGAGAILKNDTSYFVDSTLTGIFGVVHSANTVTFTAGALYLPFFTKGVQFIIPDFVNNGEIMTVVSSVVSGGDLVITVQYTVVTETLVAPGTLFFINPLNASIPAYDPKSKRNLGLVYFDEKGKTNGVTTRESFNANLPSLITTFNSGDRTSAIFYVPYIIPTINHRPPIWAKYYQWVRTKNLTKSRYLFWVSQNTYKDDKYAYISIDSINSYKKLNSKSIIAYDFVQGDRIKFYIQYRISPVFSTTVPPYNFPYVKYTDEKDFEIFEQVIDPDINGVVRKGQYLKIILPVITPDVFDFGDGLSDLYNNYYIEIYSPAQSVANDLSQYFEYSEEFAVGNPGTDTRYHQGQLQNQTPNLSQPATFLFNKGDGYYRTREINNGLTFNYDIIADVYSGLGPTIMGQTLVSQTIDDPNCVAYSIPMQKPYNANLLAKDGATLYNKIPKRYFHIKGTITLLTKAALGAGEYVSIIAIGNAFTTGTSGLGSNVGPTPSGTTVTFDIDFSTFYNRQDNVTMENGGAFFLTYNSNNQFFGCELLSGNLVYTEISKVFDVGVFDENYSDFFISKINSNGRSWVVDADQKTTYFSTLVRWGLAYQQNTNINQINRFFPQNLDEVDRAKGDIQRFKARDRILRVFQNRACGQYGVFAKFIQNNAGKPELVTTNEIITKDNINYYAGIFGLGNQYTGLVSAKVQDYVPDPVRAYETRLSDDGLIPISELYKGQFLIQPLLVPYNKNYLRPDGSKAKILGAYNYAEEEYITILQGGTLALPTNTLTFTDEILEDTAYSVTFAGIPVAGYNITITVHNNNGQTGVFEYVVLVSDTISSINTAIAAIVNATDNYTATVVMGAIGISNKDTESEITSATTTIIADTVDTIPDVAFSFNEKRNSYCTFFNFHPEWIMSAENILYSWVNGQIYVHNDEVKRSNFYGVQYPSSITLVFNDKQPIRKKYLSMGYQSNQIFTAPTIGDIITSMVSPQTGLAQISQLLGVDFTLEENVRTAAFLFDANSLSDPREALVNGAFLGGNWLQIKLVYSGSEYAWIYLPYISYEISNRNF